MEIELTPEQEASVIPAAVYFLRALTTSLGAEAGLHVWDQINATIGNDIKGKVFFAMLTGKLGTEITIRGLSSTHVNRIDIIKCIRGITGLGLKQAKDVTDLIFAGKEQCIHSESFALRDRCLTQLWNVGLDAV